MIVDIRTFFTPFSPWNFKLSLTLILLVLSECLSYGLTRGSPNFFQTGMKSLQLQIETGSGQKHSAANEIEVTEESRFLPNVLLVGH